MKVAVDSLAAEWTMSHFDQLKPQCPDELIASGPELKFYESTVLVFVCNKVEGRKQKPLNQRVRNREIGE